MDYSSVILKQLAAFFVMLLTGYLAARWKIISSEFLAGLSKLIMRILLPVLIFANAMNGNSGSQLMTCSPILWLALCMFIPLIVIFAILARVMKLKGLKSGLFQGAMIFGNAGFIGIPLIMSVYPEQGAIYLTLLTIIDQGLLWTYGIYLTTPRDKGGSFNVKNFFNPALGAVVLSIILLLADIPVPDVIEQPLLMIGRAATPLSLIYLGGLLMFCDWRVAARTKELYLGIAVKLLLFPIGYYIVMSTLAGDGDMVHTMALIAALPTMTTIAMFAQAAGEDVDYALGLVLITTMVSLVTLSIVSLVIF